MITFKDVVEGGTSVLSSKEGLTWFMNYAVAIHDGNVHIANQCSVEDILCDVAWDASSSLSCHKDWGIIGDLYDIWPW